MAAAEAQGRSGPNKLQAQKEDKMMEITTIKQARQALAEAQKALTETDLSHSNTLSELRLTEERIPAALGAADAKTLVSMRMLRTGLEDVLAVLTRRRQGQEKALDDAEEIFSSMAERPDRYKAQIEALEAGVYGKKQQAEELKSKIPSMKQRLADLPADMAVSFRVESRFDPDELRQRQHSLERSIAEDLETIAWLKSEIKRLQA
jgi:chromosome segregation ATPase